MSDVSIVSQNPNHLKGLVRKIIIAAIAVIILVTLIAACSPGDVPKSNPAHGKATKLVFAKQPSTSVAGEPFNIQPVVTVQDAQGNIVVDPPVLVTLSIEPESGTERAILYGGKKVSTTNGVVIFKNLSINLAGLGYRLTATSSGLSSATSDPFDITPGAPAKLAFTTHPYGANAGSAFINQPVVSIQDIYGNVVTNSSATVVLRITSDTGDSSAVLSGDTEIDAVNGVASFNDLSINISGYNYSLTAVVIDLPPATSRAFNVVPGSAAELKYLTQPEGATANSAFNVQPELVALDSLGNRANYTGPVTLTIAAGTGVSGAVLAGTTTINADYGLAQFFDLSIDLSGSDFKLKATGDGLTPAISNAFDVIAP